MEFIGVVIFFAAFIGIATTFVVIGASKASKQRQQQAKSSAESYRANSSSSSASNGKVSMTNEQRQRLDKLRDYYKERLATEEKEKQQLKAEKHERHVEDAHEHGHTGEEEHYEEIVGSLGDINDEGCEDLNGVRFIAHDIAYDATEEGERDYTELAKAMVLGDIVNSPRFRSPYSKK